MVSNIVIIIVMGIVLIGIAYKIHCKNDITYILVRDSMYKTWIKERTYTINDKIYIKYGKGYLEVHANSSIDVDEFKITRTWRPL